MLQTTLVNSAWTQLSYINAITNEVFEYAHFKFLSEIKFIKWHTLNPLQSVKGRNQLDKQIAQKDYLKKKKKKERKEIKRGGQEVLPEYYPRDT